MRRYPCYLPFSAGALPFPTGITFLLGDGLGAFGELSTLTLVRIFMLLSFLSQHSVCLRIDLATLCAAHTPCVYSLRGTGFGIRSVRLVRNGITPVRPRKSLRWKGLPCFARKFCHHLNIPLFRSRGLPRYSC